MFACNHSDVGRPRPDGPEPSREDSDAALKVLRQATGDGTVRLDAEPALMLFGFAGRANGGNLHTSSPRSHKL